MPDYPTSPTPARRRRYLIAVEGPDGAGKSTLIDRLAQRCPFVTRTAEPYDREWVTGVLHYVGRQEARERLFTDDRRKHHEEVLDDAAGIILTDRYYLSTVACQYGGLNGDATSRNACYDCQRGAFGEPDLWVVLDPRGVERPDGDPLEQQSQAADYIGTLAARSTAPYLVFPSRDEADLSRAVDFLAAYLDSVHDLL